MSGCYVVVLQGCLYLQNRPIVHGVQGKQKANKQSGVRGKG